MNELVVITADDRVTVVTATGATRPWRAGIDHPLAGAGKEAPELADCDGDGRLDLVLHTDTILTVLTKAETPGRYDWTLPSPIVGEPALGDLNGEGRFEIVTLDASGTISIRRTGTAGAVTLATPDDVVAGPFIQNTTPGGSPAIVVASGSGCVDAFDIEGRPLPGWPKRLDSSLTGIVAAGSRDGVGRVVVEQADHRLAEFDLGGPFDALVEAGPWGMVGGNGARTRSVAPTIVASPAGEPPEAPGAPATLVARPNPARSGTPIALSAGGGAITELVIFDLGGRLVRRISGNENGPDESGSSGPLYWDGRDASGRSVPGGLYFVRGLVGRDAIRSTRLLVIP